MKRNELLAKSLTLGLAVATAATSMSVPGGLLAPETVYAADAEDGDATTTPSENDSTSETKVTLTADNLRSFFSLNQKAILLIRSDGTIAEGPAVVHAETDADEKNTQTWYGGYTLSYKTIGESPEDIDKDFKAGTNYDVYISVNGGTRVNATTDALKLGTVTAYTLFDTDQKLTYKDSSDQTTSVKDDALENTTFKGNVTISAEDGYTVCDSADGNFGETITVTKPEIPGAYGVPVFVKQSDNDTIYARWTILTFGKESQDTPDTKKEATGTVTITGTATVEEKLIASYADGNIEEGNIAYKWYRIPVSDGTDSTPVEIDGATAEAYTLTTDDIGCKIKVEVSDKSETVTGTVASEVSAVVAKKDYKGEAPKFGENCFDKAARTLTATVANGTTAAQLEYSLDGGNTWVNGNVENSILTVDGTSAALKLTAQAYNANAIQIRVAETDDTEASEAATYTTAIPRKGVDLLTATVKINNAAETEFTYTGKDVITSVAVDGLDGTKYKVYYTDSKATEAGTNTVAPTAVGDYKLWIVPASEDSEDCYDSKSVDFSIKAIMVDETNKDSYIEYAGLKNLTLTYNGNGQCDDDFFDAVYPKDQELIPEWEILFKKTTDQTGKYLDDIVDAGTYNVYVGIDLKNIKTTEPVQIGTVTVDKYKTDASAIKVVGNESTYYGGTVLHKNMDVTDPLMKGQFVTLTYKQVKDGNGNAVDKDASEAAPVNAGTYDIYAAYTNDPNCTVLDATKTDEQIVITKVDKNVTAGQLVVNKDATEEQSIDLTAIVNELKCAELDNSITADVTSKDDYFAADSLKYADGVIKVKLDTAKTGSLTDNTKATIHVDFGNRFNNYKVAFDIPVVITTKTVANITIANATNGILGTYGKVPKQLTFTISGVENLDLTKKTDAEIKSACLEKYGDSNWAFGCTIHNQNGEEVKSIENAGTYSVHVTYWDSTCYGEITDVIVVEPKKIEQTADFNGILSLGTASFAYNFENQYDAIKKLVQLDAKDGVGSGDYDVVIKKGDSETEDASDAGSYGVYIAFNHGNYTTSGKLVQLGTVDIAKNKDAITLDVAKDGTPIVTVGSRTIPNGELQQILYVDKNGKESKVKPTAAGKYKVKVSYTNSNLENKLEGAEKEFTITSGGSSGGSSSVVSPSGGSSVGGGAATTPSKDDTKKDDTKKDTTTKTETKPDGTKVTTTETKAADGSVQTKIELKNDTAGVDATVNVAKDAQGKVTGVTADVNQTATDKQTAILAATVAQITAAAGTKDVAITTKTVDANGKTVREVTVNASDLTAGKKLKVVAVDPKTGEKTLVNKTTYKVAADGSLALDNLGNDSYEVVTTAEVNALTKEILQSIRPERSKANIAAGKKTKLSLDDALNMDNVAKITYKTSKKSVATVNPNGTVTARKEGKVTIKAIVTLNNGKKKTVRMNLTVKARK